MRILIPILLYALILPFTPWLDLSIERYFFANGQFSDNSFFTFFYNYAIYPADIIAGLGALAFLLSYGIKKLLPYRFKGLYLLLVLAIGAGLIVHVALKDHWGRPRPKQIVEFGGKQEYRAVWQPNFSPPEPSKSFPCGHCSTGYYFFAVGCISRRWRTPAFTFALILGGLLGLTRMAQGGHYFSDVITTALIMWLTAIALLPLLARDQNPQAS